MLSRTTTKTVVFKFPFALSAVDGPLPPGPYEITSEEELIPGLSFLAYRRTSTTITLDIRTGLYTGRQVVTIDPGELEMALKRDATIASEADQNNSE